MKIGCGTVLFRKFPLERSLAAIRQIGYEYFETQAVGPWCPHVNVEKDDPETLIKLKNKFGFKGITGLWSLDGNILANENAVTSGIRTVQWAAAAGIPIIHTGDGHKPAGMSEEDAFKTLEDKLTPILAEAKKLGVTIAIEPHGTFSLTLPGLRRLLSLGTPDVLGINYDGCNIRRSGYVESGNNESAWRTGDDFGDEVAVLKGITDRVVHVHVKDIDRNFQCVATGDGIVNIKGCIDCLKAAGYDGVLSVETEGGDHFDSIVALATRSYHYLQEAIL